MCGNRIFSKLTRLYSMAWLCSGWGVGLGDSKGRGFQSPFLAVLLSDNNLGQVVPTHLFLSPSSIIRYGQGAVMPCGWEGLASHWLCVTDFTDLRAPGLWKGDEQPPSTLLGLWHTLPLPCRTPNANPITLTPNRDQDRCSRWWFSGGSRSPGEGKCPVTAVCGCTCMYGCGMTGHLHAISCCDC